MPATKHLSEALGKIGARVGSPVLLSYFLGTLFLIFSIFFFSYHLAYARKIIPGVRMAGLGLGNKTESEARGLLQGRFVKLCASNLVFVADGEEISKPLSEWGVEFEASSSARAAYLLGREGNLFVTTRDKFRAWVRGVELAPQVRLNERLFEENLRELQERFNIPEKDASFTIRDGTLEVQEATAGREIDGASLRFALLQSARELNFSRRELPLRKLEPKVRAADLEALQEKAHAIIFSSPRLVYDSRHWVIPPEKMLLLLDFSGSMSVNEEALSSYVSELASQIDRPARGGSFELEDGRVIEFSLPQSGYKLDQEKARSLIATAILDAEKDKVELPVKIEKPPAQRENEYGIRTLLGVGSSNFSGSIAGRIHNIDLASSRLDGILIPPGEIFSFNQSLGEVSSEMGYQTSYIIKQGRTLLGVGGGVCQVSTTLFRAALYAGLPILERTAHAYRVHYYEQDMGPGFDATVYDPSPDLKFKNDTPAYILIKRYFNSRSKTLRFELYGTSDGRKVEVTGPVIHSQTPPPEPAYVEDPSLPKGTKKQIDWAAWGAKVTVKRKVTRGVEVLQDDTFFSNYQPWQAVYLVGTGG